MIEPFIRIRRIIEKMFDACEKLNLIPPKSSNTNKIAKYFLYGNYSENKIELFKSKEIIMKKPLAQSLKYIVDITQDGAHSKGSLKLDVDNYWEKTKDILLLKSVIFILTDCIKWYTTTAINRRDIEENRNKLWTKV